MGLLVEMLERRVLMAAQAVTGFSLVNADTGVAISGYDPIPSGATINLTSLPTHISVRANTNPATVGSVDFGYDSNSKFHTENAVPYSLLGDSVTTYTPWTPTLGSHTITATPYTGSNLTGTAGTADSVSLTVTSTAVSTPFTGVPFAIPGQIEAENFDNGGQNVAYFDTTPGNQGGSYRATDVDIEPCSDVGSGYDIGHIQAGEWLNYTVNVTTAGTYDVNVRVATPVANGLFHVSFDGVTVTGPMAFLDTGGYQTWQTVSSGNFSLTAGQHVMRITFDSSSQSEFGNVNWISVLQTTTGSTPYGGSPEALPGTVQAENFDDGGEGVAYNDTTPGNQGGAYRSTDVDIETTTDAGGGYNVGHIQAGEWLNYTVDVATTGVYAIDVRLASATGGGMFHVDFNGANLTGSMTFPNTGSYTTYTTITANNVSLTAGVQVMRLVFDSSPTSEMGNVNWLDARLTSGGSLTWSPITPSPVPLDEGQSITVNNLLYTFGGSDDAAYDVTTQSNVYNPSNNTWTALANLPETVNHAGTVYDSVTNTIWIIGGFLGPENGPAINHVWLYSIANNTYTAGPALPTAAGAEAVVLDGRSIHVISGLSATGTNTGFFNTTEHYVLSLDNISAGWTSAAPLPTPRNLAGAVSMNGLVYVVGGQDLKNETGGNSSAVSVYNPSTNMWSALASLPVGRSHISNSTLVYNGRILVVGGETNGTTGQSDVLQYDPTTNSWSTLETYTLPDARKSPVAALFGNELVVVGGQSSLVPVATGWSTTLVNTAWVEGPQLPISIGEVAGGIIGNQMFIFGEETGDTLVYNLTSGAWESTTSYAPRPFVGDHHAAEVYNGKIYLIGGLDGGSPGQVQIFDPVANTWTLGAPMPWPGGSVRTALINGKIYAAGGIINATTTTNDTAVYDPVANTWTMLAPMPMGVNHAAASTDGSKLYIFGGRNGGNVISNGFNYTQIYNPATNTWTSSSQTGSTLAPLPQARGGMGKAVYYNGEFYVMGGETLNGAGATSNLVYNRVDIYNPTTNTWRLGTPMPTARHGIFPLLFDGEIYVAGGGVHSQNSNSTLLEIYDPAIDAV